MNSYCPSIFPTSKQTKFLMIWNQIFCQINTSNFKAISWVSRSLRYSGHLSPTNTVEGILRTSQSLSRARAEARIWLASLYPHRVPNRQAQWPSGWKCRVLGFEQCHIVNSSITSWNAHATSSMMCRAIHWPTGLAFLKLQQKPAQVFQSLKSVRYKNLKQCEIQEAKMLWVRQWPLYWEHTLGQHSSTMQNYNYPHFSKDF